MRRTASLSIFCHAGARRAFGRGAQNGAKKGVFCRFSGNFRQRRRCKLLFISNTKFCVVRGQATPRPIPSVSTGNATCRGAWKNVFLWPEERALPAKTACCSDSCHTLYANQRNIVSAFIGIFNVQQVHIILVFPVFLFLMVKPIGCFRYVWLRRQAGLHALTGRLKTFEFDSSPSEKGFFRLVNSKKRRKRRAL